MGKPNLNKGFSVVEMLLVVLILGLLNLNTLKISKSSILNDYILEYEIQEALMDAKIESMKLRKKDCHTFTQSLNHNPVCFNEKGNVNRAQTLSLIHNNKKIIIHLGAGVYELK